MIARRPFFFSLLLAAAGSLAFGQGIETELLTNAKPLRVMSFNIRNSGARDGDDRWEKRRELFNSTIRTFDPDLLGLQEVLADQHDQMVESFPGYAAVGVARDDGERKGEWSMILYRKERFEPVDSGTFWLSEKPDEAGSLSWNAACVRICSWARLRDRSTGRELLYANTHFDHKSQLARDNSARLLRTHLPDLAKGAPVILSGDFNCGDESSAYQTIMAAPSAELPKALHFQDSFRKVHPDRAAEEGTFHGFKGTRVGDRIDWILHTREFTPLAAEIVRVNQDGRFPSDHFALTAVLGWK